MDRLCDGGFVVLGVVRLGAGRPTHLHDRYRSVRHMQGDISVGTPVDLPPSEAELVRRALSGSDATARDAEIARFLAAPETVHPVHYESYAEALEAAGRSAEARAWRARAILRLQIDHAFLVR